MTTTSLTSSSASSSLGTPVEFSAYVSGGEPTGSVQFMDAGVPLSLPVSLGAGRLARSSLALSVGTHSIAAVYTGDADNLPSTSAVLSHVVMTVATTTELTTTPNPSIAGGPVTLAVRILGYNPTGSVTFRDAGTAISGGVPIALSADPAVATGTFTTSVLPVGTHFLSAVYSGDTNNEPSSSAPIVQLVNHATVTVSITSTTIHPAVGEVITLTATVRGENIDGTVQFSDENGPLSSPLPVVGGAASFTTALTLGAHLIKAAYTGTIPGVNSTSAPLVIVVGADDIPALSSRELLLLLILLAAVGARHLAV